MDGTPVNGSEITTRPRGLAMSGPIAVRVLLLVLMAACSPNGPPADTVAPTPLEESASAPDQAVDAALTRRLGLDTRLDVRRRNALGNWVFECGKPVTAAGAPMDYRATSLREQAAEGLVDDNACALLEQVDQKYIVRELSVGDTDAPFVDWPQRYGLPDAILGDDG